MKLRGSGVTTQADMGCVTLDSGCHVFLRQFELNLEALKCFAFLIHRHQRARVSILPLVLSDYVTFSKLFNFSMPQFYDQ